jgi:hypothetical protein
MNPASTPLHHNLVLMGTYSSPPMLHVECAGNLSIGEASTLAFSVLFWEPSARDFSPTSHSLTHSLPLSLSLFSLLFSSLPLQVTALLQQVDNNINRATDSAARLITDAREFAGHAKKAQASIEVPKYARPSCKH